MGAVYDENDIVQIVLTDHRTVENQIAKWQEMRNANNCDEATKWFNQLVFEIARHSVAEEQVLYPLMEAVGKEGLQLSENALQDHKKIKVALEALRHEKDEAEFDRKMQQMLQELLGHMQTEEDIELPFVMKNVPVDKRISEGPAFQRMKAIGPTLPHPSFKERPQVLQAVVGLLTAPVDRLRDLFKEFPSADEVQATKPV